MAILKILFFLGIAWIALKILFAVDLHCKSEFGHKFLTKKSVMLLTISMLLGYFGKWLHENSLEHNSDASNGMLVMMAAAGIVIYMLWVNYERCGWRWGTIGSAVQLTAGLAAATGVIFLLCFACLTAIFSPYWRMGLPHPNGPTAMWKKMFGDNND